MQAHFVCPLPRATSSQNFPFPHSLTHSLSGWRRGKIQTLKNPEAHHSLSSTPRAKKTPSFLVCKVSPILDPYIWIPCFVGKEHRRSKNPPKEPQNPVQSLSKPKHKEPIFILQKEIKECRIKNPCCTTPSSCSF